MAAYSASVEMARLDRSLSRIGHGAVCVAGGWLLAMALARPAALRALLGRLRGRVHDLHGVAAVVTISIGPAFDATGMTEAEVNRRVETWIEGEMRRLDPEAYR